MIKFKKNIYKDRIVDKKDSIIQKSTPINAELLNRQEGLIEEIVNKVNR